MKLLTRLIIITLTVLGMDYLLSGGIIDVTPKKVMTLLLFLTAVSWAEIHRQTKSKDPH